MALSMRRPFVAVQVTLTSANMNYNLLDLVNAIITAESANAAGGVEISGAPRSFNVQAHPGIDGAPGNTNDILIGDALLSTTRFGYVLTPGGSIPHESTYENAVFGGLYARSAGASQKLNIEIMA